MGTVTLTTEEYAELLSMSVRSGEPARVVSASAKSKPKRRGGKTDPRMAKALKMANDRARKKNGDFRKGFNQKKLMELAHKIRRKL